VWASRGQSIKRWRWLLWKNIQFHCFEPLSNPFSLLKKGYSHEKLVHLHNFWLWDADKKIDMHVSNIDDSSSILAPTERMSDTYKQIHFSKIESISIKKLDTIFETLLLKSSDTILMKVDTQGFEWAVFEWSKETLKKISLIVVELSFTHFYEAQPLFSDILKQLETCWFMYCWSFEQSADPRDWKPLQQDALFINNNFLNVSSPKS
jgi:FkbM family methyltransferase